MSSPSSSPSVGPGRRMIWPYTFSAKVAQFPYKFMWTQNWVFRYYAYGLLFSMPIFYYIHTIANSPAAIQAHKERKAKEAAELEKHRRH